ncbi:MAG: ThuA domain-containing protein [Agriterribacter sp.]
MHTTSKYLLTFLVSWLCLAVSGHTNGYAPAKVVILAGAKSHPAGFHEYIKSSRLLKAMLEKHAPRKLVVDIFYDWPTDSTALDNANVIVCISDGRDGHLFKDASFLVPERVPIIEKQMKRGCGLVTFHFSTFAPDAYGDHVLQWAGGYFDWQDDKGDRNWYSNIVNLNTQVLPATPTHPLCRGVKPFTIEEEFYYNIRFPVNEPGWKPILTVPALKSDKPNGNTVAWAIERKDGSRGFGTTMGHHFANWKNDDFRKLVLNGIVWAAGVDVPVNGVNAPFYTDREVTNILFKKKQKALILTGDNIEAHEWPKTTVVLQALFEKESPFHIDISTDIEDLGQYNLRDYDVLILNYCNWNRPTPLSDLAKQSFTDYLSAGGGLMILHFSNGAFHSSLPNAPETDWPEYRKICRRIWDHHGNSAHDAYGLFTVNIRSRNSAITKRLKDFETTDELYYNQKGTEPVDTLLSARSKNTGKDEPLAWQYQYHNGRIFQTLLGHNAQSYSAKEFRKLLLQAALWASGNAK